MTFQTFIKQQDQIHLSQKHYFDMCIETKYTLQNRRLRFSSVNSTCTKMSKRTDSIILIYK